MIQEWPLTPTPNPHGEHLPIVPPTGWPAYRVLYNMLKACVLQLTQPIPMSAPSQVKDAILYVDSLIQQCAQAIHTQIERTLTEGLHALPSRVTSPTHLHLARSVALALYDEDMARGRLKSLLPMATSPAQRALLRAHALTLLNTNLAPFRLILEQAEQSGTSPTLLNLTHQALLAAHRASPPPRHTTADPGPRTAVGPTPSCAATVAAPVLITTDPNPPPARAIWLPPPPQRMLPATYGVRTEVKTEPQADGTATCSHSPLPRSPPSKRGRAFGVGPSPMDRVGGEVHETHTMQFNKRATGLTPIHKTTSPAAHHGQQPTGEQRADPRQPSVESSRIVHQASPPPISPLLFTSQLDTPVPIRRPRAVKRPASPGLLEQGVGTSARTHPYSPRRPAGLAPQLSIDPSMYGRQALKLPVSSRPTLPPLPQRTASKRRSARTHSTTASRTPGSAFTPPPPNLACPSCPSHSPSPTLVTAHKRLHRAIVQLEPLPRGHPAPTGLPARVASSQPSGPRVQHAGTSSPQHASLAAAAPPPASPPALPSASKRPVWQIKMASDPLSNLYPCHLLYRGQRFRSAEQAFQFVMAQKAGFPQLLPAILQATNGVQAKHAARPAKNAATLKLCTWGMLCPLRHILRAKHQQVPAFRAALLRRPGRTLTHPVKDSFWGAAPSTNPNRRNEPGRDWYAHTLTQIRAELLAGYDGPPPSEEPECHSPPPAMEESTVAHPPSKESGSRWDPTPPASPPRHPIPGNAHRQHPTKTPMSLEPFVPTIPIAVTNSAQPSAASILQATQALSPAEGRLGLPAQQPSSPAALQAPPNSPSGTSDLAPVPLNTPPPVLELRDCLYTFPQSTISRYVGKKSRWTLPPTRASLLILGDHQLSMCRHATMPFADVQVLSLPRATVRTLHDLLHRSTPPSTKGHGPPPTVVLIAVGINHRSWAPTTTTKELAKLLFKARRFWPKATLVFPLANTPSQLGAKQASNLACYNRELSLKSYLVPDTARLPPLPNAEFQVSRDGILWSATTAQLMLDHWARQLRLTGIL